MPTIGELIYLLPPHQKSLIRNIEKHNAKLNNIKASLVFNQIRKFSTFRLTKYIPLNFLQETFRSTKFRSNEELLYLKSDTDPAPIQY